MASIIAGGTQFRRTHRLHSQLKELEEAKHLVAPESRERSALEASVATVALELSAHILIKRDTRKLVLVGVVLTAFVGSFLIFTGYMGSASLGDLLFFPLGAPADSNAAIPLIVSGMVIFLTGYVALFLYAYVRITASRRRRLISRLMTAPDTVESHTVLLISHHLNHHAPVRGPKARAEKLPEEISA